MLRSKKLQRFEVLKKLDNHQLTVLSRFEIKMKAFAVSLNNCVAVD